MHWLLAPSAGGDCARKRLKRRSSSKLNVFEACTWSKNVVRVVAMDDSASLLDLHEMIQEAASETWFGKRLPRNRYGRA